MHGLEIGQPASFGFVVGVGNIIAGHRALAADFAYFCHDLILLLHPCLEFAKDRLNGLVTVNI